jgi:membrane fusion protein (multidrug efflux system)
MRFRILLRADRSIWGLAPCAVAAALLAIGGCAKPASPAAPPPPVVGVVESRRMSVPVMVTPNGTTRSLEQVTVRARVRGFLTERHFEEGATVKRGQLLFVIDEEPYQVALQSARARLAEAESALRKSEAFRGREVAAAQVDLDQAQLSLARIQEHRFQLLLKRNAGSVEDLDKAAAERKRWEAQVEADRANLEQAAATFDVGIAAAKAQVEAARAAVRDAELNLGYCRMVAHIDGRIGEAKVKVGNLVGADASGGGAFTDLATIHQLDPMGVDIRLSSRDLDRIRGLVDRGLPVRLARTGTSGDREHPEAGTCYFIDNAIDETTSTFLAKARFPNPGGALLPGEYVKLRLEIDRLDDAVVVPAPSVMETETGPVVYTVDGGGKAAIRNVEAARSFEGLRVITKGLDAGVPVIAEGLQSIRPGIAVKAEAAALARPLPQQAKAGPTGSRGEEEASAGRPAGPPKS